MVDRQRSGGRGALAADGATLARTELFAGVPEEELDAIAKLMRACSFAAGEELCAAGDPSDRMWLITSGLVHWLAATTEGAGEIALRMRRGDVIGAQDAITGEERSATVVASIPTTALELDAKALVELAERFPQIPLNVIRTQRQRLFRASARTTTERGEEIALALGPSLMSAQGHIVAAARTATPRPVTFLDRRLSVAGALTASDQLASDHATVLLPGELEPETLVLLLDEVDRVVALAGSADEADRLARIRDDVGGRRLEVILVGDDARKAWPGDEDGMVVRTCPLQPDFPLADVDLTWLARHLTGTKLGVALGAGGAKGYAHVGVLQVLEEAGYTIDYVGGSSIGSFVASHLALGHDAKAIEEHFRAGFNPDLVGTLFAGSFGVKKEGVEALTQMLQQTTEEKSFSDTVMPLIVMAVDLTDRAPAPLRDGPIWEALIAALSVAGVFPAREREGHALVDGIALVPVPTASVFDDGADIVLSVNLLGAATLDRWPVSAEFPIPPEKPKKRGLLDTMLEVMDLSQLDTSARHAALADAVVTPRFGPADWRDFHLGELFLEAGRAAALEQLPVLQAQSRPVDLDAARRESVLATLV